MKSKSRRGCRHSAQATPLRPPLPLAAAALAAAAAALGGARRCSALPPADASAKYDFSAQVASSLRLEWSVLASAPGGARWRVRLTSSGTSGWASIGFNDANAMGGTDAVLVEPIGGGVVSLITMTGHSGVSKVASSTAAHTLSPAANFSTTGALASGWVCQFDRALAAGSYTGARTIPASGDAIFIAAWGGDATVGLHSSGAVTMAKINLATGAFATGAENLRTVHAVIMALAWAVLVPGSAALVRYGYVFGKPDDAETRANRHMMAQCLAVLLTAAGGVVALVMVPVSAHFKSTHGIVGIFVILGALAQPCLGFCCASQLWAHRTLGYATMALGAAALYLGLALNGVDSLVTLYFVALALALAAIVAIEFRAALVPLLQSCAEAARRRLWPAKPQFEAVPAATPALVVKSPLKVVSRAS